MKNISKKEDLKLTGKYKFTVAKLEILEHFALNKKINMLREKGKEYISLVRKLNEICQTRIYESKNIIPTVGRSLIADNLANSSPTNTMKINYSAIGFSTTAVANSDLILVNEQYRRVIASTTSSDNIVYISSFYGVGEAVGTYYEHGLFSDATGVADSGILFSRVLLNTGSGIIIGATETLTIDYQLIIS